MKFKKATASKKLGSNTAESPANYPRSKGEQTKEKIVLACLECLIEHGYSGTNYESVGQKLGLRRAHVAYHFPKKEDLFAAAIAKVYQRGQKTVEKALLASSGSWKERLRAYVSSTFVWIAADPSHPPTLTLAFYLSCTHSEYKTLSTEVRRVGFERVQHILSDHPKISKKTLPGLALRVHSFLVGECLRFMTCTLLGSHEKFAKTVCEQILAMIAEE